MSYINMFDELCFWSDVYPHRTTPTEKQLPVVESMGWANGLISKAVHIPLVCEFKEELTKVIAGNITMPENLWEAMVYTVDDSDEVVKKYYPEYAPILDKLTEVFELN